jgi:hypothetical protein
MNSFKHKAQELYAGNHKVYKPFDDADKDLVPPAGKEIVDSVPSKLGYTFGKVAEEYDFLLQKEETNRQATADLVVNGKTLVEKAPVTFLLALERRLEKIRIVANEAPTLPNGLRWIPYAQKGPGYFQLEAPEVSYRTKKNMVPVILYAHTEKHPAQVKESEETKTIGQYNEMKFEGRLPTSEKSMLLERLDILLQEVKKAIRRANQADVVERKVGAKLFEFILNGKV